MTKKNETKNTNATINTAGNPEVTLNRLETALEEYKVTLEKGGSAKIKVAKDAVDHCLKNHNDALMETTFLSYENGFADLIEAPAVPQIKVTADNKTEDTTTEIAFLPYDKWLNEVNPDKVVYDYKGRLKTVNYYSIVLAVMGINDWKTNKKASDFVKSFETFKGRKAETVSKAELKRALQSLIDDIFEHIELPDNRKPIVTSKDTNFAIQASTRMSGNSLQLCNEKTTDRIVMAIANRIFTGAEMHNYK